MKTRFLLLSFLLAAPVLADDAAPLPPLSAADAAKAFKTPTLITLKFNDAPVYDVFDSLMTQAKLPYSKLSSSPRDMSMTINVDKMPFWDAVMAFQKASGWDVFHGSTGSNEIAKYSLVHSRRASGGLRLENGPFLAYITGTTRAKSSTQSVTIGDNNPDVKPAATQSSSDELRVAYSIMLDPAINMVAGTTQITGMQAIDENGQPVFASPFGYARGGDSRMEGEVVGIPQKGLGHKIAHLKLDYRTYVALEPETLTWDNLDQGNPAPKVGPRGDGVENYEVADAKAGPGGYSLTLHAYRPTDGLEFRDAGEAFFDNVQLIDGNGQVWIGKPGMIADKAGMSNPASVRKYEASLHFGRLGDTFPAPLKLVWTIPARFQVLETNLEWKDIPLP